MESLKYLQLIESHRELSDAQGKGKHVIHGALEQREMSVKRCTGSWWQEQILTVWADVTYFYRREVVSSKSLILQQQWQLFAFIKFWFWTLKMWTSVYVDVGRFALFISFLVFIDSLLSVWDWMGPCYQLHAVCFWYSWLHSAADCLVAVLLLAWCMKVSLKMETDCKWSNTWSSKQPF